MNAQIDYPYDARGGSMLQHITPLPGATEVAYNTYGSNGVIELTDNEPHTVLIEVQDANRNSTRISFSIQFDESLTPASFTSTAEQFLPNEINIFERENFQLVTSETTMYDAISVSFNASASGSVNSISPLYSFLSAAIPAHDSVTVRISSSENIPEEMRDRIVIKNVVGSRTYVQKA